MILQQDQLDGLRILINDLETAQQQDQAQLKRLGIAVEGRTKMLAALKEAVAAANGEAAPSPEAPKTVLKSTEAIDQVVLILTENARGMTLSELWEAFVAEGFLLGGQNPRNNFAACLSNELKAASPRIARKGSAYRLPKTENAPLA